MIDIMDAEENGGNQNGLIDENEFLSYLGNASEVWAFPYDPNDHDKEYDDPWSDERMTADDIRDSESDWSFLWQNVHFFMLHFPYRKSEWIVDTRTQYDRSWEGTIVISFFMIALITVLVITLYELYKDR